MLYIIGTGLWRGDDISVRGAEICKKCAHVYLDEYTRAFDEEELGLLESIIGKPVVKLGRRELEERLAFIEQAKESNVALLIPGDPLVATTHITIIEAARKKGVRVEVVHGSTIHTAIVGEAGLHIYKVGGACTIPMREKGIRPYSTYDKIAENVGRGLHTIVFLDTAPEKQLSVREAIEVMQEIEGERGNGIFADTAMLVVGCRMGSREQKLLYSTVGKIKNMELPPPCTLVVPGKLHFSEEDALRLIQE
ncbi:MAG: diphthine synthase [Candidatus Micrarchaeia archaeon]